MTKLAVFPASGKLGTSIYSHLFNLINPRDLILISRDPSKIPDSYKDAGVITREADYNKPSTLEHAFDDVTHLVLISYPSIQFEHRFQAHLAAITAARASNPGVTHIFYTSLAFGGDRNPISAAHVMQAHLATEKCLAATAYPETSEGGTQRPFTYTAIREGIYSESFPMYTGFFDWKGEGDEVRIPHDGSGPGIAWAKIDELGDATAQLVRAHWRGYEDVIERYRNKTIVLSGPRAWTLSETVARLNKITQKEATIQRVSVEEYVDQEAVRENLHGHGPGDVPREWATSFEAIREGETAVVTDELQRLLGREPEGFETTARRVLGL